MENIFSNFSQMERNGLLMLVVSMPLLAWSLWNLYLSNISKSWPKVKGEILEMPIRNRNYLIKYQYIVQGATYHNTRIFFCNSREMERRAKSFRKIYHEGQTIDVFHDPNKPKRAVLQPGRKDGFLFSILFLTLFAALGAMALYDPYRTQEFISELLQKFQ